MGESVTAELFDLVVIGTGAGGSAPATKCRKEGWTVAVIDDQPYGGTCALRGCDPKKVLVGAAELISWQRRMRAHGASGEAAIAWPELMRFKRSFTDPVPATREAALEKFGVARIHGEARFIAEDTLLVGDRQIEAKHIVIATGAEARKLKIPGEEHVISSTEFLELAELPKRITFVGAGYISLEFAHVVNAAGAKATIYGRGQPLPGFDDTLVGKLIEHSRVAGIVVELETEVTAVERVANSGSFRVHTSSGGKPATTETDLVVHGAGRVPGTARLGADRGNVRLDARGAIEVNEYLQSVSNPRVYAAGDVVLPKGSLPLTPVGGHEGAVVASNLLKGNHKRPDYRGIASVVFTLPPLAAVGVTESAARKDGLDIRVESGDTSGWYSSRRTREPVGMFKTIVDANTEHVLGAHLLGAHADETINLFALAVRFGITAPELKQMIYAYPTSGSDLPFML